MTERAYMQSRNFGEMADDLAAAEQRGREQERARIERALRLYPEWCKNWGMDRNLNVATQAATECADMLATLPAELPEDDDEAAAAIYKALP